MEFLNTKVEYNKIVDSYVAKLSKNRYKPVTIKYNVKIIRDLIIRIGKTFFDDFVIDDNNKEAYNQLYFYFTGSKKFSGDLKKGLHLWGLPGSGKTIAFMIFERIIEITTRHIQLNNINNPDYEIVKTMKIKAQFSDKKTGGFNALQKYIDRYNIWVYDDIGEEIKNGKEAVFYSDKCNVMEYILTNLSELQQEYGTIAHITSNYRRINLSGKKFFFDHYGERVDDRMKKLFNEIEFKGSSRR